MIAHRCQCEPATHCGALAPGATPSTAQGCTLTQTSDVPANCWLLLQVLALPEPNLRTILRFVPLSYSLTHLPPACHRPALLGHHPSIEEAHTLQLAALSSAAMDPALAVLASCTTLVNVSLAGESPHAALAVFTNMLTSLSTLTSLDLRDTGLSHRPTASALAAGLASLHQLATLDLSDNLLTLQTLTTLQASLCRCAALRTLRMLRSFSPHAPDGNAVAALVPVLQALTSLTALSLGGIGSMLLPQFPPAVASSLRNLVRNGIPNLHKLQVLELHFFEVHLLWPHMRDFTRFLAGTTTLRRLALDVPSLNNRLLSGDANSEAVLGPPTRLQDITAMYSNFSKALGQHSLLTSLALDLRCLQFAATPITSIHASLQQLTGLRTLQMQVSTTSDRPRLDSDDLQALAPVLPHLTNITRLHISASTRPLQGVRVPNTHSLGRLLDAVTERMPQVTVLHVPVAYHTSGGSGIGDIVEKLLRFNHQPRAHPQQLTLDLHASLWFGGGGYTDEAAEIETCCLLFPYACVLDIELNKDGCLLPLAKHTTALTQLHTLRMHASEHVVAGAALDDVLPQVALLDTLKELHIWGPFTAVPSSTAWIGICAGLPTLTALTSLRLFTGSHIWRCRPAVAPFPEVLRCAPSSLLELRVPQIAAEEVGVYVRELSRMRLRTLLVEQRERGVRETALTVGPLQEVVATLQWLRTLTVTRELIASERVHVDAAAATLCGCQSAPYQMALDVT